MLGCSPCAPYTDELSSINPIAGPGKVTLIGQLLFVLQDPLFSPGMYETSRMTVFLGGHEVCPWPLLTTFCMAMGYALATGFNCIHTPSRYTISS
jgi:hypothetical protein